VWAHRSEPRGKLPTEKPQRNGWGFSVALIAKLLRTRLEYRGHTISWVADGNQALARAVVVAPDLILLDVTLPGMNRLALLHHLKHNPVTHAIPVLILTAQVDGRSVIAGIDGGADANLSKPIDFPGLMGRVEACLTRRAERACQSTELEAQNS
jgi:DNA-binding response OmpR family regulator